MLSMVAGKLFNDLETQIISVWLVNDNLGATRNASRITSFGIVVVVQNTLDKCNVEAVVSGTAVGGHRRREIALADFPYLYSRPRWRDPQGQGRPLILVGLYPKTGLCRSRRRNQHPRPNDCLDGCSQNRVRRTLRGESTT